MHIDRKTRLQLLVQNGLFVVLFLALIGLLAYLSRDYQRQWDLTQGARNSVSRASLNVLAQLKGPVTITAYATKRDPRLGDIRAAIREFIAPYHRAKPDLTLKFVDPVAQPAKAKAAGVQVNGELVVSHDGISEHLAALNEMALTNLLMRLARGHQPLVMYLDGHGERKLDGMANADLGDFGRQLRNKGFKIAPLNLTLAQDVPANADLLVVAGPRVEVLPGEVEKIRHYLARGGNLLWLIDQGSLRGLRPLADQLGLILTPGTVVDPAAQRLNLPPSWALASVYGNHPITRNFNLITVFPLARQIGVSEGKGWRVTPLLEVAPNGWLSDAATERAPVFDKTHDTAGPITIGAALERKTDEKDQRIVVIGNGAFLSNTYLGNAGNLDLGVNIVNWLTGADKLITIQPRPTIDGSLELSRLAAGAISIGFMIVLPLLFLAAGGIIWRRRRR